MQKREDHPLAWLEQSAPHVPEDRRARYSEIYALIANGSGLLHSAEELRQYDHALKVAWSDLVSILQEMASGHPDDSAIASLLAYYIPKSSNNVV
jgi:hypothetical protein